MAALVAAAAAAAAVEAVLDRAEAAADQGCRVDIIIIENCHRRDTCVENVDSLVILFKNARILRITFDRRRMVMYVDYAAWQATGFSNVHPALVVQHWELLDLAVEMHTVAVVVL